MYHRRYIPYPYYRRYYNIDPYHYRRYYYPHYNIVDSQYASVDQNIVNYGDMSDVIQDAVIYQSMTPEKQPEKSSPKTIPLNDQEIKSEVSVVVD